MALQRIRFWLLGLVCRVVGHRDQWWTVVKDDLRTPDHEFSCCRRCVRIVERPVSEAQS